MSNQTKLIIGAIDEVRPFLQQDGGDIEFVGFEDNILYVNILGACTNCASLEDTLKLGVETIVKDKCPFVEEVRQATDEELWKDYM